jgi:hypothetical protein
MTAPTLNDRYTLWRFTKDRRDAHCVFMPHPEGYELRYMFNGVVLIGMVARDTEQMLERARQWRLRLVADGWDEIEQDKALVRAAGAGRAMASSS